MIGENFMFVSRVLQVKLRVSAHVAYSKVLANKLCEWFEATGEAASELESSKSAVYTHAKTIIFRWKKFSIQLAVFRT